MGSRWVRANLDLPRGREGFTAPRAADRVLRSPAAESLPNARRVANLRCGRARRRQRRACARRCARARGRGVLVARGRAARVPRRQQPPHAQPALHAHGADGGADRRLYGRRVLADLRGHGRADRREAGAPGRPRHRRRACWMRRYGVRFSRRSGARCSSVAPTRFLGGGKALMNSYYAAAERRGVEVTLRQPTSSASISPTAGSRRRRCAAAAGERRIAREGVVVAAGGFESNLEWLREAWGEAADNFIIRGTPYNTGTVLEADARRGRAAGRRSGAVPRGRDRRARAEVRRRHRHAARLACRLGIVVNRHGERFYDEGEDFWPKRYAIWGRLVAQQPDQIAYSIVDAKAMGRFMPSVFPPIAAQLDPRAGAPARARPADALEATVVAFNHAVRPGDVRSRPCSTTAGRRASCRTRRTGRSALDTPPFWRIRCGPASRSPISAWRSTSARASS